MPEYRAKPGQQDRHGEMTGAITINMILTMVPVAVWSFFVGWWVLPNNVGAIVVIAVVMSLVLPFVFLRPSQWLWAWFSHYADKW